MSDYSGTRPGNRMGPTVSRVEGSGSGYWQYEEIKTMVARNSRTSSTDVDPLLPRPPGRAQGKSPADRSQLPVLTANFSWAVSQLGRRAPTPTPAPGSSPPPAPFAYDNRYDAAACPYNCNPFLTICDHRTPRLAPSAPRLLGPTARPAATARYTLQQATSNADPAAHAHEMESTDAGPAPAVAAPPLPENSYNNPFADGLTLADGQDNADFLFSDPDMAQTWNTAAPQTPGALVGAQQTSAHESGQGTPATERVANILANGRIRTPMETDTPLHGPDADAIHAEMDDMYREVEMGHPFGVKSESWTGEPDAPAEPRDTQGFAKLMFADGDYIVTTHDVELGRNMEVAARYKRQQKELRREQEREQRRERVPSARKELAQRELEMYQQEPSQPSLHGDDGQRGEASNSNQSLEGRPAPQSTFSESGGALAFQDFDEEADVKRGRKKKRSMPYSKSSTSTTSVVPANLHPPVMTAQYSQRELFNEDGEPFNRTLATLPIHTQQPEDINKISKRHLLFTFNFPRECWQLHVVGNGAFVNDARIERDGIIDLNHNDEIVVSSVMITFKLPDSHRHSPGLSHGTFSQVGLQDVDDLSEAEDAVETSPARRLSNALEDAASSDDEPLERRKGVHKLKLKSVKKMQKEKKAAEAKRKQQEEEKAAPKISLKKQQRKPSDAPASPVEEKKAEKGKKPKEAAKQPAEAQVVESIETPPAPPVFTAEPGSVLASIPIDELPQKRKGPGRPPKNGLVSKRDQALIRKKERDFEKAGLAAPPFNKLLDMVRAETKNKEMQAKMASGALPPGTAIPQTVETDLAVVAAKAPSAPTPVDNGEQSGSVPADSTKRQPSPRPKRVARSPSPMKPETSYTEDELKKPSATYVHILDEILRDHPSGHADLQEIYDRIQKRYPYYKYRVTTQGWQSSVRHNLLSAPRFKETGRSGKGKLWTIDHDVPLEREKKKKPSPPPRPPMMNGPYMQYGQQPYGNGYPAQANGQRPANGGPGYYPPYAHGQAGQHPQGQHGAVRQGASPAGQAQGHASQPQQQSDPFGGLVPEIIGFRTQWLKQFENQPHEQAKSVWIGSAITAFSDRFHGSRTSLDMDFETEDEKDARDRLDALFNKYAEIARKQKEQQQAAQHAQNAQHATPSSTGAPAPVVQTAAPAQGTVSQPVPAQQQPQQPTVQNAVANGVAYQTANGGPNPHTSNAAQPSTATGQHAPQQPYGPPPTTPMNGHAGSSTMPSVPQAPAQTAPSYVPSRGQSMPYAPPPPDAAPSGQVRSPQNVAATATPAQSVSAQPPPQPPPPSNVPPQLSQQDADVQAAAPSPAMPVSNGQAAQPSPAPVAQAPVAAPVATPQLPAERPPTAGSSGTKRAAEDEAPDESEAKRAKVEEA